MKLRYHISSGAKQKQKRQNAKTKQNKKKIQKATRVHHKRLIQNDT